MSKFKVGDKVKVVKTSQGDEDFGIVKDLISTIISDDGSGWIQYRLEKEPNRSMHEWQLELVEEKRSSKFKVGDQVEIISVNIPVKIYNGRLGTIIIVTEDTTYPYYVDLGQGLHLWCEIKEAPHWKKCSGMKTSSGETMPNFESEEQYNTYCYGTPKERQSTFSVVDEASDVSDSMWYLLDSRINKTNKKTFMENIVSFAKNLTLSADEKLLREAGLKDSNGEYTHAAQLLVTQKLMKDNEAYLIEVATAAKNEKAANKN